MSYVIAVPEMMTAAATDLAGIGSELSEAHMAAAPPTVALMPAAADEVSAGVAHLFSRYAEDFHGLAAQAAAFNDQFVQNLRAGAFSYTDIEAALTALLHHNLLDWLYSQYGVSNVVKVLADLEVGDRDSDPARDLSDLDPAPPYPQPPPPPLRHLGGHLGGSLMRHHTP